MDYEKEECDISKNISTMDAKRDGKKGKKKFLLLLILFLLVSNLLALSLYFTFIIPEKIKTTNSFAKQKSYDDKIYVIDNYENDSSTNLSFTNLNWSGLSYLTYFGSGGSSGNGNGNSNPVCGNGIKEGNEECDDGDNDNNDCCNNKCEDMCEDGGSGVGSPDKECKDKGFDFGIVKYECGGAIEEGSRADDYNITLNWNNCISVNWTANPSVGGVLSKEATETFNYSGGTSGTITKGTHDISHITFCGYNVTEYCGDGIINGDEKCEENNDCDVPICEDRCIGNDYYEYKTPENDCVDCLCEDNECSVKNISYNDSRCIQPYCGDGNLDLGEQCDDGNLINGDGCDENCKLEVFCDEDSDCGEDGWLHNDFCKCTTNVWDWWINYTCVNPGQVNSYCTNSSEIKLKEDCGDDSCTNWQNYCKNDDVWKNRTCYDVRCLLGECFNNSYVNETFVEDCGEDEDREWNYYCVGKEVWRNKTDILRGCEAGECYEDDDYKNEKVKECEFNCVNGECVDECCNDEDCDDGIFCNGQEKCVDGKCENGTEVDCHGFDLCSIEKCNYTDDGNPFTWDYFPGFISICDEELDSCTIGYINLTHECDFDCGAECIEASDCPEKCTIESHKLYINTQCSNCSCKYTNPKCIIGKCGAVCDENEDCTCPSDYCNGTTLIDYSTNSSCGTSGSQGCLCQLCVPTLIYNATECGYVKEKCGDGVVNQIWEQCDDGNLINGDGCDENCKEEKECCEDEDCLADFYSEEYCYNEDVYWDLTDYFCQNGECLFNIDKILLEDCGEDYYGNWVYYCDIDDVHRQRQEITRGCENGACFENIFWKDEFVEHCAYGCEDEECTEPEQYCGDGVIDAGEECDDENNVNGDGCSADCEIEGCPDKDFDCICDQDDWCLNSRIGEPVNEHGCDPFQFCGQLYCGEGCYKLDFRPRYLNCTEIESEPEIQPGDCTVVMISKEGQLQPKCLPTTCAN